MLHSNFEKYAHLHIVVVQILQSRVRGEETGEAVCQLEVTAMFSQGDYEFGLQMALQRVVWLRLRLRLQRRRRAAWGRGGGLLTVGGRGVDVPRGP